MSAAQLKALEDRLAILALQVDYARAADSFDGKLYAAVFTEDGVLDATGCGIPIAVGHDAIAATMDNAFAQQTHNVHFTTNQRVLNIDGDHATGFAYFLQRSLLKNGGRTEFAGRYDDEYRRTAQGWRISRRVLVELLPTVLEGYDPG